MREQLGVFLRDAVFSLSEVLRHIKEPEELQR